MNSKGLSGRLIGAVFIALIGFFIYMSQVQENPITGEKQHIYISPDQEIRLGLESAPEMTKEMGGELPPSDPRTQEVKRIGDQIANHTDAKKSPWKFQFHLLADTKTINAFALPGGQVFITLGLLNQLETEAQLAGVLGHEVGHVIERHTAQQMSKNQLGQMLVVAVGVGVNDSSQQGNFKDATIVAALINHMFQLKFSRQDESQSDIWGIKLLLQMGYDPRAMIQVMNILKSASGKDSKPQIFKTHPNPDLRIQQIKAYLEEHPSVEKFSEGRKLKEIFKEHSN